MCPGMDPGRGIDRAIGIMGKSLVLYAQEELKERVRKYAGATCCVVDIM